MTKITAKNRMWAIIMIETEAQTIADGFDRATHLL
jgi:hypothetical protein